MFTAFVSYRVLMYESFLILVQTGLGVIFLVKLQEQELEGIEISSQIFQSTKTIKVVSFVYKSKYSISFPFCQ